MSRRAFAAVTSLAAALLFPSAGAPASDVQKVLPTLGGRYFVDADSGSILITPLAQGEWRPYRVVAIQWEGVGLFDGTTYWGVFRRRTHTGPQELAGASGTHRAVLGPDGSLAVHGEFTAGGTGSFETVWRPERIADPRALPTPPAPRSERPVWPSEAPPASPGAYPKLGDYVYVEELPEAITKVPPSYPEKARNARIDGLVVVQALVGGDGLVKDTHVTVSIPGLDEAAVACVQQWVYKPARAKGRPVAVWVAVPVRFTLH